MIHGEYDAESYTVFSDDEELYTAGNSPFDSQGYVAASDGVGLAAMRSYCWITCRDMAAERNEELGTIQRRDNDA